MRKFIDEKGTFEIKVPITWKYSLKSGKVHTFQDYEIWKSDTFQLSIIKIETHEVEDNFKKFFEPLLKTVKDKDHYFRLPDKIGKEFSIISWVKRFNATVVFFTLTYSNNIDKKLDNKPLNQKVETCQVIIKSLKLIEESNSTEALKYYRFEMFLQGIGATVHILNKAIVNKAFIEATCILANQIDAFLRTGIILKQQILNRNIEIESEWIYQGPSDKKKSEKDIYNKSKALGIIDENIFNQLQILYDDRNRVIHRFIISEITLAEVEQIAHSYYLLQEKIYQIIYDLESEQIRLGIGMTILGPENQKNNLFDSIKGKFGKQSYFDKKAKKK